MQIIEQYQEQVLTNDTKSKNTTNNHTSNIRIIPATEDNNYYNNYNKAHATGRFMTPEDCERIKEAYRDNINSEFLTAAVAHMIEKAFNSGLTADEIVMAIEETGFAPKPSPWYLRKVLENWAESGCIMSRINKERSHPNYEVKPWWK